MIYEFAVEPRVMIDWKDALIISNGISLNNGRLVSDFPTNWDREAHQQCKRAEISTMSLNRSVECIARIKRYLLKSSRPYQDTSEWLQNALEQDGVIPFRAIIVGEREKPVPKVLQVEDLTDENVFWAVPRQVEVVRTARDMAHHVEQLTQLSSTVKFVDPHFCADQWRFTNPLMRFIDAALKNSRTPAKLFEYHYSYESYDASEAHVSQLVRQRVLRSLPAGVRLVFYRWKRRHDSPEFHDRFVLTEIGGYKFGQGLDENDVVGQPSHVVITLLEESIRASMWKRFDVGTADLDLEGNPISITS